ncbi:MAG: hypothetical protein ASARMPREDX12_008581 [Alectoria sarmentosa]|nr:MAG: hypothetical protein ASARMPREDX12_008581 [Alectoria sarmentosa]
MCSASPAHSKNALIALDRSQNSLFSRSLQSATSQFDHALSKRATIHTGFSADGWKVRFTATATLIPLQSAALTLEQFYESIIDKLPGMNFRGLDNPVAAAASLNVGGITMSFRTLPGKLTNDFMLSVAQTMLEACRGGWETAFNAEWINPARDLIVYVAVQVGSDATATGPIPGPLERGRL